MARIMKSELRTRLIAITGVWLLALGAVFPRLGEGSLRILFMAPFPVAIVFFFFPAGLPHAFQAPSPDGSWSGDSTMGSVLLGWMLYASLGFTFCVLPNRRIAFVVLAALAALLTLNVVGCYQMPEIQLEDAQF